MRRHIEWFPVHYEQVFDADVEAWESGEAMSWRKVLSKSQLDDGTEVEIVYEVIGPCPGEGQKFIEELLLEYDPEQFKPGATQPFEVPLPFPAEDVKR